MSHAQHTDREQDTQVAHAQAWLLTIVHHDDPAMLGRCASLRVSEQMALGRECGAFGPSVLDAPLVSRRHALLECHYDGSLVVRDLESTNGTWRNGHAVAQSAIDSGDILRVGSVLLTLRRVASLPTPHRDAPFPTASAASYALYQTLAGLGVEPRLVLVSGEPDTGIEGVAEALRRTHAIKHPVEYISHARGETSLHARVQGNVVLVGPLPFDDTDSLNVLLTTLVRMRPARVLLWWPLREAHEGETLARSLLIEQHRPVVINLPRLCERVEDIPLYAVSFSQRHHRGVAGLHHALVLAMLRAEWRGNLRALEEFVRLHLVPDVENRPLALTPARAQSLVPARHSPAPLQQHGLRVSLDGAWFEAAGTDRVTLQNRYALARILGVLAQAYNKNPSDGVSAEALISAGWPGQRLLHDAAVHRLHVAIGTLRKLGLRDALARLEHGYRLEGVVIVSG